MKKKIIGFVGVALFATGLYVNQARGDTLQDKYHQAVITSCESSNDLGYDIMIIRQTPITVDQHIQMIKDVGVNKPTEENAIRIVKYAHEKPLVDSNEVSITARAFGNEIQDKCLKDMTGIIL